MNIVHTRLPEVVRIEPRVFPDHRGHFQEIWSDRRGGRDGLPLRFVQDNMSLSKRGVVRGLHYQFPHGQGKLVTVLSGAILDVAVDLRRGSPSFGRWVSEELSAENHRQLYIPPGFAHGFAVLGDHALVSYKCTDFYHPEHERGLLWNDPDLGIEWPIPPDEAILNDKDRAAPRLRDVPEEHLPLVE